MYMIFKGRLTVVLMLITVILGCGRARPGWKTVDIGDYQVDVPNNFDLKLEKGIDTEPGHLRSNELDLNFDYGRFCDTLIMTKQEYLRKGFWKDDAITRFLHHDQSKDIDWVKTQVVSLRPCLQKDSAFARGCDLIASCTYQKFKFDLPVYFPAEIKDHVVKTDTLRKYRRRLVCPIHGINGTVGVYMSKVQTGPWPGPDNSIVISASNLNSRQQALAMQIVASLRPRAS